MTKEASKNIKTRIRVTITAVREYKLVPENYPEEIRGDPEAMLAIDIKGAEDDVILFLDSDNTTWSPVKGEIIKR